MCGAAVGTGNRGDDRETESVPPRSRAPSARAKRSKAIDGCGAALAAAGPVTCSSEPDTARATATAANTATGALPMPPFYGRPMRQR